jgi:hypothetical protein
MSVDKREMETEGGVFDISWTLIGCKKHVNYAHYFGETARETCKVLSADSNKIVVQS